MGTRTYHGWIFTEVNSLGQQIFKVQHNNRVICQGYGDHGAVKAVDFFKKEKGLGHVWLEATPLGLRVFTKDEIVQETAGQRS